MGKRPIKFRAPQGLMIFLGGLKEVLDGLALIGAAGTAVEAKFQFVPWATVAFLGGRIFIGYIMRAYISQEISTDDK